MITCRFIYINKFHYKIHCTFNFLHLLHCHLHISIWKPDTVFDDSVPGVLLESAVDACI